MSFYDHETERLPIPNFGSIYGNIFTYLMHATETDG